ncbi:MAG: hypothetical protein ACO1OG_05970 [Devosia sp.]
MAGYQIELYVDRSPDLARYYAFQWQLIGNIGVQALMVPFATLFGVELGTKLIALLIPVVTAAGFLLLAREAHGRIPTTALAAIPLAYNYWFMYGFTNYCLAAALSVLALALWMFLARKGYWKTRAAVFVLVALVVWACHAVGWVMLVSLCGAAEMFRRFKAGESPAGAIANSIVQCVALISPLPFAILSSSGGAAAGWFNIGDYARSVAVSLRDRWLVLDLVSLALLGLLVAAAVLRLAGLRLNGALLIPALALGTVFMLAPTSIGGSYFVNGRLFVYALAIAVLAIDTSCVAEPQRRILAAACMTFLVVRLFANTASLAMYDQSYQDELQALRHVPQGSAVVAITGVSCGDGLAGWFNTRLYNLPGMAVVRKDAFVNSTFAIAGLHLVTSRYAAAGAFQSIGSGYVSMTGKTCSNGFGRAADDVLSEIPYQAFDMLWMLDVPAAQWPNSEQLQLVWSNERSALYRIVEAP